MVGLKSSSVWVQIRQRMKWCLLNWCQKLSITALCVDQERHRNEQLYHEAIQEMPSFPLLVNDKHCLWLSLRSLTEPTSPIWSLQEFITHTAIFSASSLLSASPPHLSFLLCLSPLISAFLFLHFYLLPPPSLFSTCTFHCYLYMNLCSLSRGPHKLIKRGENLTLHIDHIPPDRG